MENFTVTKIDAGEKSFADVQLSEEVPLTIEVNDKELATLLSTPEHLKNLVTGFLFTSGFISRADQIASITIEPDKWKASVAIEGNAVIDDLVFKRIYTSGCGKGVLFHNPLDLFNRVKLENHFQAKSEAIREMMKIFQKQSEEHTLTRGIHSAALASANELLIFRDDIGRHNAIDKVIGEALFRKLDLSDKMIFTSGRISSEILSKALRCRMPVIAAIGAPTNQAVKLARQTGLTLAGLVRGARMFVYSGDERIC